jgi:hypothetical protein
MQLIVNHSGSELSHIILSTRSPLESKCPNRNTQGSVTKELMKLQYIYLEASETQYARRKG